MDYTLYLSEDEVKEWSDAFHIFDSTNQGFISKADLELVRTLINLAILICHFLSNLM
jgi:Ca2+-binding EF-hand superfamily protein